MKKWLIGILLGYLSFVFSVGFIWGIKMAVAAGESVVLMGLLVPAFFLDYFQPKPRKGV